MDEIQYYKKLVTDLVEDHNKKILKELSDYIEQQKPYQNLYNSADQPASASQPEPTPEPEPKPEPEPEKPYPQDSIPAGWKEWVNKNHPEMTTNWKEWVIQDRNQSATNTRPEPPTEIKQEPVPEVCQDRVIKNKPKKANTIWQENTNKNRPQPAIFTRQEPVTTKQEPANDGWQYVTKNRRKSKNRKDSINYNHKETSTSSQYYRTCHVRCEYNYNVRPTINQQPPRPDYNQHDRLHLTKLDKPNSNRKN